MYARHMAWLAATPEKEEQPRRSKYMEGSPFLELITLTKYEDSLVNLWYEAGSVAQGANGLVSLEWDEIISWADKFFSEEITEYVYQGDDQWRLETYKRHTLLDYELQLIKTLSQSYASEYSAGTDSSRPCPKEIVLDEDDAAAESIRMGQALMEMFGVKAK